MSFFKELFKTKKQRAFERAQLEESIRRNLEEAAQSLFEEHLKLRMQLEAEMLQQKMDSDTPWYEPIIGVEESAPVDERYRWNAAFIQSLSKRGMKGDTDVEKFQSYLDAQIDADSKRIISEARDKLRNSSEPWVEVIGDKVNSDGEIQLQLDWNDAFVKYLRTHGFRGATEDVIIQKWLISLDQAVPESYQ